MGRMSVEEWAEIAIEGVDKIKDRAVEDEGLRYVGGKLKFAMSEKSADKVAISFELYFQDDNDEWHKVGADSGIYSSGFTPESLEEIKSKGEILFEVEG